MVSLSPGSGLRIHEGYAHAPDEVLAAIGRFLAPGVRRSARAEARRTLLSFPAEEFAPPAGPTRPRREPARPGDATWLTRLRQLHEQYNRQHFTGSLSPIPIRLSSRMKRRLGELAMDRRTGTATEIGISRRHIRRDGWDQVAETMLHEMVHQWQAEAGLPVNHDAGFRKMAAQVGIDPRAVRRDW